MLILYTSSANVTRRVKGNDKSPLGLEEDRCTGEGQQGNLVLREQCLITLNTDQRLAYDTMTACIENDYIFKKWLQLGSRIFKINASGECGKHISLMGYWHT